MSRTNAVASSSRRRQSPSQDEDAEDLRKPVINGAAAQTQATENGADGEGREHEDEDDDEDDPQMRWTMDTFTDVPVGSDSITQLRELKASFLRTNMKLAKGVEMGTTTATWYEMIEEDHPKIAEIQEGVLSLIDKIRLTKIRVDVVDAINERLRDGEMKSIQEFYERRVAEETAAFAALTTRMKYKEDERFAAFRQAIWEVNHEDEPCPPMSHWLPREAGDGEEDDDDFEIGGATQKFICPLTMRPYEDATRSSECGHYYSYAAVTDYIRQSADPRRPVTKCPFSGCSARLTAAKLVKDPEMQRRTDKFIQRQRQREEDNDEDEGDYINIE